MAGESAHPEQGERMIVRFRISLTVDALDHETAIVKAVEYLDSRVSGPVIISTLVTAVVGTRYIVEFLLSSEVE